MSCSAVGKCSSIAVLNPMKKLRVSCESFRLNSGIILTWETDYIIILCCTKCMRNRKKPLDVCTDVDKTIHNIGMQQEGCRYN